MIKFKRNITSIPKKPANGALEYGEIALDYPSRTIWAGTGPGGEPVRMGVSDVAGGLELSNDGVISGNGFLHPRSATTNIVPTSTNIDSLRTRSGTFLVETAANQSLNGRPFARNDRLTRNLLLVTAYPLDNPGVTPSYNQTYIPSTYLRHSSHPPSWYAIYTRWYEGGSWTPWYGTPLGLVDDISGSGELGPVSWWGGTADTGNQNATQNHDIYVISGDNTGFNVMVNGSTILQIDRRQKYGQGNVATMFRVAKGDTWRVWRNGGSANMSIHTRTW